MEMRLGNLIQGLALRGRTGLGLLPSVQFSQLLGGSALVLSLLLLPSCTGGEPSEQNEATSTDDQINEAAAAMY